jgi:hypothetical protein
VKELEVEVSVWKHALSTTRNGQDHENKAMVTFSSPQKNIALCVIDGTRSFFSKRFIVEGEEGGRRAGQEIVLGITHHLATDDRLPQAKLSITIYVRKAQLRNDLTANGVCTCEQFDEFFVGLNETSYLNIVEVTNKRDVDKKIEGEQTGYQINNSPHVNYQNTCNFSLISPRPLVSSLLVRTILSCPISIY